MLRGGADVNATGGNATPLAAQGPLLTGAADAGSAAHRRPRVGRAVEPQTHASTRRLRARVAALRIAQAIKRGKAAYEADGVFVGFASPAAVADVFESCVIPHLIASELWREKSGD